MGSSKLETKGKVSQNKMEGSPTDNKMDNLPFELGEPNSTASTTDFADFKANLEGKYEELTSGVQEWKTGIMNAYLLNEEVSLYDWSQGPSNCIVAKDYTPCCTSDLDEWKEWKQGESGAKWEVIGGNWRLVINEPTYCRTSPAYNMIFKATCEVWSYCVEDPVNGEEMNRCYFFKYYNSKDDVDDLTKEFECPANRRKACVWDRNGVGCCTENMELLHSWHDTGCVDDTGSPGKCSFVEIMEEYGDDFLKYSPAMKPSVLYVLQQHGRVDRFNFECPTHHPIPTVAILLGCFIPAVLILLGIVLFMHFRKTPKEGGESDEEEAAIDEIPPIE